MESRTHFSTSLQAELLTGKTQFTSYSELVTTRMSHGLLSSADRQCRARGRALCGARLRLRDSLCGYPAGRPDLWRTICLRRADVRAVCRCRLEPALAGVAGGTGARGGGGADIRHRCRSHCRTLHNAAVGILLSQCGGRRLSRMPAGADGNGPACLRNQEFVAAAFSERRGRVLAEPRLSGRADGRPARQHCTHGHPCCRGGTGC